MFARYVRPVYWVLVGIAALDNAGFNMGATLTGLGVGGVALALSAQEVAKDAIASLTMMLDRAFEEGDVIAVQGSEDKVAKVKKITPKHTILEAFDGERLILANRDIANARVRNFGSGMLAKRRLFARVKVDRATPPAALEALPGRFRDAVNAIDDAHAPDGGGRAKFGP